MSVKPAHSRTLAAAHEHLRRAVNALHPSRPEFANADSLPSPDKHRERRAAELSDGRHAMVELQSVIDALAQRSKACASCGSEHDLQVAADRPLQRHWKQPPPPFIRVFYMCGQCEATRRMRSATGTAHAVPCTAVKNYMRWKARDRKNAARLAGLIIK